MINGIFDTHAHYDDHAFDPDREEVICALADSGIAYVMNPGCDRESSEAAVGFAGRFDHFYAGVGWHPENAEAFDENSPGLIRAWALNKKVVAIGEIGLDYHYDDGAPAEVQKQVMARQMELARELGLPVSVHDRDAHADTMEMIASFPEVRGVVHCYSGSAEMAKEIVKRGWYLGFTGAITFKNARRALESIAVCPNDRIVVETDSPYLAPVPNRGRRCDSRYLPLVIEKIAEVKGLDAQTVADMTRENGKRLYNIK